MFSTELEGGVFLKDEYFILMDILGFLFGASHWNDPASSFSQTLFSFIMFFFFFFAVWRQLTSFVFLRKDKLYKNCCFQRKSLRLSSVKNL